jgi:hypothetical protein
VVVSPRLTIIPGAAKRRRLPARAVAG